MKQIITIKGIRKFNEQKVIERTLLLFKDNADELDVMRRFNSPMDNESESFTLMTENASTQGINIKQRIGGNIIVELPWFASELDVRLFYAFLNAVKKVHRMARVVDEDDKTVKLTDCDAEEQWNLRRKNMKEILNKGERMVLAGVNREFHLEPSKYYAADEKADGISAAFEDFIALQWIGRDVKDVIEEKRHITEDEELSSIRVVDNTDDVFIGTCQYVGMMKKNTCKMVKFEDFCQLMGGEDEFGRMDVAQAFLYKMNEERWNELFDKAEGIVRENLRKTFVMRWNTDISNYKLCEFEDAMEDFCDESIYYDWSIWDYQKAHIGDRFYMIRTGEGKMGVVMRGTIIGMPYPDEDWSGKGRKVYYIRMRLSHMIHSDKSMLLLTTKELSKAIPEFNWEEGHSGEILNDTTAMRLDEVWNDYVEKVHQMAGEEDAAHDFNDYFKEKGWEKITLYQKSL